MPRYTVTGDAALDSLIDTQLNAVVHDLLARLDARELDALVLGGGYGRGEGGALHTDAGLAPYNDYDLVLVHHCRDRARLQRVLGEVHREHTARCHVHVDVTPLVRDALATLPPTLTWCELRAGHHVLYGPPNALHAMGPRPLSDVPASEWGRLLFNRGSGLLFALWALQEKSRRVLADEDFEAFATRQVAKAWLTLGDVWLADRGAYATSVRARRAAIERLGSAAPPFAAAYLAAVDFKLSPVLRWPTERIVASLAELAPLFADALSSRASAERRPLVGVYATLRAVRATRWGLSRPWRYPRERLRIALCAELRGNVLQRQRLIGSPDDYITLWERYG